MKKFINYSDLSKAQKELYKASIQLAFPKIILASKTTSNYWNRLEKYFPEFQFFLIADDGELIGFFNTTPIAYHKHLDELPDQGWDWLLTKGIEDYEKGIKPNCLGGLQVIIRKEHQGKGYSKDFLNHAKQIVASKGFSNFIIPIRPTKKHEHPKMLMEDYLELKIDRKIYDPWIRTHLKNGAQIIKVCNNSMNIKGDIAFWETIINKKITKSDEYLANGALNTVKINVEKNNGEYREANIWIHYPLTQV